ncbi:MAG: ferritin-like domain-containing protein [Nitrospirales bacterium]|nr:ferritin-like domain-containing protein [Nitrospirales bacterium]
MSKAPSEKVMSLLKDVFQEEMAGIIRYMHYSFMIMGHNRIPIQSWFRSQANESMRHAILIGEKITSYGGHPTLVAAAVPETNSHQVDKILEECIEFEGKALEMYKELVAMAGDDIALEELARQMVRDETEHLDEVAKMLRKAK